MKTLNRMRREDIRNVDYHRMLAQGKPGEYSGYHKPGRSASKK